MRGTQYATVSKSLGKDTFWQTFFLVKLPKNYFFGGEGVKIEHNFSYVNVDIRG